MPVTFKSTSNERLKRRLHGQDEQRIYSLHEAVESCPPFAAKYKKHPHHMRIPASQRGQTAALSGRIVQTSPGPASPTYRSRLGLISAIVTAYNQHLDLVLDPNAVWVTLLAQFCAYMNGDGGEPSGRGTTQGRAGQGGHHAEEKKSRAAQLGDRVDLFDQKRAVVVKTVGTLFTADFEQMTIGFLEQLSAHVTDAGLRDWVLPGFSTSTLSDSIAAVACCLSTVESYYADSLELECGIPQVTLEGTVDDWRRLRSKIDKFEEFELAEGLMRKWVQMLQPICDNFVRSAEGHVDLLFWDTICHRMSGGSGADYLSGWVTAFSVFDSDGKFQGGTLLPARKALDDQNHLSMECFVAVQALEQMLKDGEIGETEFNTERQRALEAYTNAEPGSLSSDDVVSKVDAMSVTADTNTTTAFSPSRSAGSDRTSPASPRLKRKESGLEKGRFGYMWAVIDSEDLNHNVMSVPVNVDDNGVQYKVTLFAGHFVYERVGEERGSAGHGASHGRRGTGRGYDVVAGGRAEGGKQDGGGGGLGCVVRPRTDWAIAVNEEELERAEERAVRLADCRSMVQR